VDVYVLLFVLMVFDVFENGSLGYVGWMFIFCVLAGCFVWAFAICLMLYML
jgi:hypothetical protein